MTSDTLILQAKAALVDDLIRELGLGAFVLAEPKAVERYAAIKPANSRWNDGWLISMTSIDGYEMVRYPGERPFVLSRAEWKALPEYRRCRHE